MLFLVGPELKLVSARINSNGLFLSVCLSVHPIDCIRLHAQVCVCVFTDTHRDQNYIRLTLTILAQLAIYSIPWGEAEQLEMVQDHSLEWVRAATFQAERLG